MKAEWFAGRLKELREQAGMTQQDLADKAGMKLGGIRNLEQGRTYPEWPSVIAICQALGVNCAAFTEQPTTSVSPGPGRPPKQRELQPNGNKLVRKKAKKAR